MDNGWGVVYNWISGAIFVKKLQKQVYRWGIATNKRGTHEEREEVRSHFSKNKYKKKAEQAMA